MDSSTLNQLIACDVRFDRWRNQCLVAAILCTATASVAWQMPDPPVPGGALWTLIVLAALLAGAALALMCASRHLHRTSVQAMLEWPGVRDWPNGSHFGCNLPPGSGDP